MIQRWADYLDSVKAGGEVHYNRRMMFVRFVGTYKQYDAIDTERILSMELKPIRTEAEYRAALAEVERLFDTPEDTAEADRLEVLALLVENYEAAHYPMDAPDPIAYLLYVMESRGIVRKDLEPFIGNRGRVAEVLNRARPLSLAMIRTLSDGLKIPAALLIQPYELRKAA